jgi:alkylhydroperoxidase family enzyme
MFIIKHVKPEDASGKVAKAYTAIPSQSPVPEPLLLLSASPQLAFLQSDIIRYFINHDRLDAGLLAMIRYVVACDQDYGFCMRFNAGILQKAGGLSEAELQLLQQNPESAPLEPAEKALLLFVLKVVRTPQAVGPGDVDHLKTLGWQDRDILDACFHATSMLSTSILVKALSVKEP